MKAWVLHGLKDIRCDEVDVPKLADDEVLVKVKAAGICGSDIPRIYTSGAYNYPLIAGHEFAGQIESVGNNVSERWKGKRVGVFPLIPCNRCIPCGNKQYEMCRNYSYLGSRRNGGFAEYVAVPESNLIELPDAVSYEQAAMLEPMAVAVHAIRRAAVKKTDRVAVCGMGTIGLFVVMFLIEQGVKDICVVGNKDFQKDILLKMGIRNVNYCDAKKCSAGDWLRDKSQGYGFDVFIECVGKNETVELAVNYTAPGGRVVLVGNPYGDMVLDRHTYWKILRHQLVVTGTWNSTFTHSENDDWNYVLKCIQDESIAPQDMITHRLGLADFERGLLIMKDKLEPYVKVMLVM